MLTLGDKLGLILILGDNDGLTDTLSLGDIETLGL